MTLREYLVWQRVDTGGPDFTVGEQEAIVDPVLRSMVPGYTGVDIKSSEAYQVYRSNESRQVPASFFDQPSDQLTPQQMVNAGTGWGGPGPSRTVGVDDFGADGQLGTGGDVFDTPADMGLLATYDADTRAAILRLQGGGADTAGARTVEVVPQWTTPWSGDVREVIYDTGLQSRASAPPSPLVPAALALGLAKLLGMF